MTKNWREKLLKRAQDREFSFFNPPPIDECPNKDKHRGPEGPNEDIMSCLCGTVTYSKRPWGETFGHHLPDCSLPIWHESYCQPGGNGHPPAETIRG